MRKGGMPFALPSILGGDPTRRGRLTGTLLSVIQETMQLEKVTAW